MVNPRNGEIEFQIGGKAYTYLLGTYGLARLEQRMGKAWPEVIRQVAEGRAGVDFALAAFHAGLLLHHEPMTEREASVLLDELTVSVFAEKFAEAIKVQFPDQDATANPMTAAAPKAANGSMSSSATG
jgi:hypothetical protein